LIDPGFFRGKSAAPVTLEELGVFGPILDKFIIFVLATGACYCLVVLWKSRLKLTDKFIWSLVIAIPLFGPLIYSYRKHEETQKK
jgi:hypothetical protein